MYRVKLIFAVILAAALPAQEPVGVIEGSLRDSTSRAPLAEGRITLRGPVGRSAMTPPGGGFRFEQLPAGDYEINVDKVGYVDSAKGAPRHPVRLKSGAITETEVIDLAPLGALEGAVLDDAGKPLGGVSVNLAGGSQLTDNTGRFAFDAIVPGSYQIAVSVPHAVRTRNLTRDSTSGDYYGYAPAQYYPGADDPKLAIPITIPAGARLRNVDLRLRPTLLVEFSGQVIDMADHEPIAFAGLQLTSAVEGPRDPFWTKPAGQDGSFRFSLIQPGAYTLAVFRRDRSPLPYVIPVHIGKAGQEDFTVPLPPLTRLEGRILLRDSKTEISGSATIRIAHRSGASMNCETRPDGSFEFEKVPPGEYQIDVTQSRNLRMRSDTTRRFSVRAIRFGGQNGLWRKVEVSENGNPPIEVEFTDEPAGISGTVSDAAASAHPQYVVTIAPVVSSGTRRMLSALIIARPNFEFSDLAPGEYEVTAVLGGPLATRVDVFNRSCEESVRVTVRQGAVSTITLRPCP